MFTLLDVDKVKKVNKHQFRNQVMQHYQFFTGLGLLDVQRDTIPSAKQRGFPASFGASNFDLVLDIMFGIRISQDMVKCMGRAVKPEDFTAEVKFALPRRNVLDPATEPICFTDFAPRVFQKLRELHGITEAEYIRSVGPEQLLGHLMFCNLTALAEKISEGRSGALFYFSHDGKFIIKQIPAIEAQALRRTLPDYYKYILTHPNSLICKYFAFFEIDGNYFIAMKNVSSIFV